MAIQNQQDIYYVPEQSKLPIVTAIGIGFSVYGASSAIDAIKQQESANWSVLIIGLVIIACALYVWFREAISENKQSLHNAKMKGSYRIAMQWFIFSEVMFFAAFFGALFYIKYLSMPWIAGEGEGGRMNGLIWNGFENIWPSIWSGIDALTHVATIPQEAVGISNQPIANNGVFTRADHIGSPFKLPLINTLLLISSSFTVHWAHHAIKHDKLGLFKRWMVATLLLGVVFIGVQAFEYYEAYVHMGLTLKSGVYGSTFFMLTGFHGFHVCMGAFILCIQMIRGWKGQFSSEDHFGFEAGSWYWHFVDVVWIFLFLVVYLNIF
jgi:cytochrome c oxidase subunit III